MRRFAWGFEGANVRRLLGATAVSSLGDGLLVTGLPLLARETSRSPVAVAAVFAAGRLPWVFALWLGAVADRREARKTMIWADLGRAVVLALIGIVLLVGDTKVPLVLLLFLNIVMAIGSVLYFAAAQRAIPTVVPSSQLEAANGALTAITTTGEQFIGPPLGALFLTGGTFPLLGDAVSFIGSAAVLSKLDPVPGNDSGGSLRSDVSAAWQWFIHAKTMRLLSATITAVTCVSGAVLATEVVIIRDTLGLAGWWFAAFTLVMALGSILGSAIASRVVRLLGPTTYFAALVVCGIAYLACAGSRSVVVVFVAMFFQQCFVLVGLVASLAIRQRIIPAELRGRVITLSRSFSYGSQVVGGLVGGWVAKRYGTDTMFAGAGALTIVASLPAARTIRNRLNRGI
jgi:MFS family permease